MQPNVDPVELAAQAGEAFIKTCYYVIHDTRRDVRFLSAASAHTLQQLHRYYQESSLIVWNGCPYRGVLHVTEFFKQLAPTTHTIQSIDCQPVVTGVDPSMATPSGSILVTVTGMVSFANGPPRPFYQAFVLYPILEPERTRYFVGYDCFRTA